MSRLLLLFVAGTALHPTSLQRHDASIETMRNAAAELSACDPVFRLTVQIYRVSPLKLVAQDLTLARGQNVEKEGPITPRNAHPNPCYVRKVLRGHASETHPVGNSPLLSKPEWLGLVPLPSSTLLTSLTFSSCCCSLASSTCC